MLSLLFMLLYVGCIISCSGSGEEPLDITCQKWCERFFWITQGLMVAMLVACLWEARPWQV